MEEIYKENKKNKDSENLTERNKRKEGIRLRRFYGNDFEYFAEPTN